MLRTTSRGPIPTIRTEKTRNYRTVIVISVSQIGFLTSLLRNLQRVPRVGPIERSRLHTTAPSILENKYAQDGTPEPVPHLDHVNIANVNFPQVKNQEYRKPRQHHGKTNRPRVAPGVCPSFLTNKHSQTRASQLAEKTNIAGEI